MWSRDSVSPFTVQSTVYSILIFCWNFEWSEFLCSDFTTAPSRGRFTGVCPDTSDNNNDGFRWPTTFFVLNISRWRGPVCLVITIHNFSINPASSHWHRNVFCSVSCIVFSFSPFFFGNHRWHSLQQWVVLSRSSRWYVVFTEHLPWSQRC